MEPRPERPSGSSSKPLAYGFIPMDGLRGIEIGISLIVAILNIVEIAIISKKKKKKKF